MIRVVVDTRERAPFAFPGARVTRSALPEGDYCLWGDRDGLVIERKSVEDLFGSVTKGLGRFSRELDRLVKHCAFPVLLVEGTATDVKRGVHYSLANGGRVLDHVLALCVAYGLSPMFCDGRVEANDVAQRLLYARAKIKGGKYGPGLLPTGEANRRTTAGPRAAHGPADAGAAGAPQDVLAVRKRRRGREPHVPRETKDRAEGGK